jgi:short subunit dehydrogenase-like uncharacterized protein
MSACMVYGCYGYTGELVVREALAKGLRPTLAGRDAAKVQAQAEALGLPHRVFSLDDSQAVRTALDGIAVVIHCAGPFEFTALPMAEACIATGCHYLDITGEIIVFESIARLDARAREAGVMLMPGSGFDVVPSDCLAAHLKRRLPEATDLQLAFCGLGGISHGTQLTMTINIPRGGAIRRDGKITKVPPAWRERDINFGERTERCMTIPWGDVSTAFYSTGIPNIMVFMAAPDGLRRAARMARWLGPVLGLGPVQKMMQSRIKPGGPSDAARAKGHSLLWGEATDGQGNTVTSTLKTVEGYTLTAMTSVLIALKVLAGNAPTGFQTPSKAYGADLIMEVPETERRDVA